MEARATQLLPEQLRLAGDRVRVSVRVRVSAKARPNFLLGTSAAQEAIDTDDGSAYYRTYENFFVYAANGLKSDFNGHSNEHYHNVYGFVDSCWGPSRPWLHTGESNSNLKPNPNSDPTLTRTRTRTLTLTLARTPTR